MSIGRFRGTAIAVVLFFSATAASQGATGSAYAGGYIGTLAAAVPGTETPYQDFGLYVRSDGTAAMLMSSRAGPPGGALTLRAIFVDDHGHFASGDPNDPLLKSTGDFGPQGTGYFLEGNIAADRTVTGTLKVAASTFSEDGGQTYHLLRCNETFSGMGSATAGTAAAYAGIYFGFPTVIIRSDGQAFIQSGASGFGSVDGAGNFSGGSGFRITYSGRVDPNTGILSGTAGIVGSTTNTSPFTTTREDAVPTAPQQLVNISSRAAVGTGASQTIAGFVVGGSSPIDALVRAAGPSLSQFGVNGVLAAPKLELYSGDTRIATNTRWSTNSNADHVAAGASTIGAFPLADQDSAVRVTLAPGPYTALVSGANGETGIGLAEVYDLSSGGSPRLINISTRAAVGPGEATLIAGFVIAGNAAQRVAIRGIGPSLAQSGLSGLLVHPHLSLYAGNGQLMQEGVPASLASTANSAATAAGAFSLQPGTDEPLLLARLSPGGYTVQLTGTTPGLGMVEIYQLP